MKIGQVNKFLMITISLLVLMGCDPYEFVDTDEYHVVKKDEYHVVKKDEVREFESKIQWGGLNISTELEVKHLDGRLYYKILVEDLGGESIQEQDYYEVLREGSLRLLITDKDGFEVVNEIQLPVSEFSNQIKDNKRHSLVEQGSLRMEKTTYIQIEQIRMGTIGI
tara:strand:+ start:21 stop:518 length:498 start_codon:yes stop_codon:yes gene_type:complete